MQASCDGEAVSAGSYVGQTEKGINRCSDDGEGMMDWRREEANVYRICFKVEDRFDLSTVNVRVGG